MQIYHYPLVRMPTIMKIMQRRPRVKTVSSFSNIPFIYLHIYGIVTGTLHELNDSCQDAREATDIPNLD